MFVSVLTLSLVTMVFVMRSLVAMVFVTLSLVTMVFVMRSLVVMVFVMLSLVAMVFVTLSLVAMVSDCGISWSYSLVFDPFFPEPGKKERLLSDMKLIASIIIHY